MTNITHAAQPTPRLVCAASFLFAGRKRRDFSVATQAPDSRPPALVRCVIPVRVFKDVDLPVMHDDAGRRPGGLRFQDDLDLAARCDFDHASAARDRSVDRSIGCDIQAPEVRSVKEGRTSISRNIIVAVSHQKRMHQRRNGALHRDFEDGAGASDIE